MPATILRNRFVANVAEVGIALDSCKRFVMGTGGGVRVLSPTPGTVENECVTWDIPINAGYGSSRDQVRYHRLISKHWSTSTGPMKTVVQALH